MDRRPLGGTLALVAAVLILAGLFTPGWWLADRDDDRIASGLRTIERCSSDGCEQRPIGEVVKGHDAFFAFGWIALGAGVAGACALVVAAGLALARREVDWPVMPASAALVLCLLALIAACVLMVIKPFSDQMRPGYSFLLVGSGCTLGLLGAIFAGRTPP